MNYVQTISLKYTQSMKVLFWECINILKITPGEPLN